MIKFPLIRVTMCYDIKAKRPLLDIIIYLCILHSQEEHPALLILVHNTDTRIYY